MTGAYATKRLAPTGYVAVTQPLARKLYEAGKAVTLCGNNVNSYHVFHGWYLGYTVSSASHYGCDFDHIVVSYLENSATELARYVVYYVKKEDME